MKNDEPVDELADARRVEADGARRLAKALVELVEILEKEDGDFGAMEKAEEDVLFRYRVYRMALLHRKAVYEV